MRNSIRLLIADDHLIFAEALRAYLERWVTIIGVVTNGLAMVEEVERLKPDIVVVDIGMPLLNGLEAARRVKERSLGPKFIFLTMQDDPNLAAAALELGPIAFILKQSAGPELLTAIDEVLKGHFYLTPRMRASDWVETRSRARQFTKDLTPRQREIVQMLAEGRPIKEIAGLLNLSEKTIEFHKHHIMVSFSIKSNADLVLFALKRGLIHITPGASEERFLVAKP
jgi:DNA-binding NarL/FixJ family response regulator